IPGLELSPSALNALETADWPGNIRELEAAIERAVVIAGGEQAKVLERHHLVHDSEQTLVQPARAATFQAGTREFQRGFVADALKRNDWNVVATAAELDLSRQYLHKLIDGLGLERPREEPAPGRTRQ